LWWGYFAGATAGEENEQKERDGGTRTVSVQKKKKRSRLGGKEEEVYGEEERVRQLCRDGFPLLPFSSAVASRHIPEINVSRKQQKQQRTSIPTTPRNGEGEGREGKGEGEGNGGGR
jgi:hypothetical protein